MKEAASAFAMIAADIRYARWTGRESCKTQESERREGGTDIAFAGEKRRII